MVRSNRNRLYIATEKYQRLFDYIDKLGLDVSKISKAAGIDIAKLNLVSKHRDVEAHYYSKLYLEATKEMERQDPMVPWSSGVGTEAFRMQAYCMIQRHSLESALSVAEEFDLTFERHTGRCISLIKDGEIAYLNYRFDCARAKPFYAPLGWDRAPFFEAVSLSSGLRHWSAMIGWLTGRKFTVDMATVAAPYISDTYQDMLEGLIGCPIVFGSDQTRLKFSANQLEAPIVQTTRSLEHFLSHTLWQYWNDDAPENTTTTAIKSLINGSENWVLPRFNEIATRLFLSPSTLRRRLAKEKTTYQQIKDECREDASIEYLQTSDLKIHEISEILGFAETGSFIRSFRKWTGLTPKAYREASKDDSFNLSRD